MNKFIVKHSLLFALILTACGPVVTPLASTGTPVPSALFSATPTQRVVSPIPATDTAVPPTPTVTPTQRPLTLGPDVIHARANPQGTGAYDFPAIRTLPEALWQKRFDGNNLLSTPFLAQGVLYVGVQRK